MADTASSGAAPAPTPSSTPSDLVVSQMVGTLNITDAATGRPVSWVDTLRVETDDAGKPVLLLGTHAFQVSFTLGTAAPAPAPAQAT